MTDVPRGMSIVKSVVVKQLQSGFFCGSFFSVA